MSSKSDSLGDAIASGSKSLADLVRQLLPDVCHPSGSPWDGSLSTLQTYLNTPAQRLPSISSVPMADVVARSRARDDEAEARRQAEWANAFAQIGAIVGLAGLLLAA